MSVPHQQHPDLRKDLPIVKLLAAMMEEPVEKATRSVTSGFPVQ